MYSWRTVSECWPGYTGNVRTCTLARGGRRGRPQFRYTFFFPLGNSETPSAACSHSFSPFPPTHTTGRTDEPKTQEVPEPSMQAGELQRP